METKDNKFFSLTISLILKKMQKAVIYVRGNNLSVQKARCKRYAKRRNYQIAEVFSDTTGCATSLERPGLKSMLQFISKQENGRLAVFVSDLCRLTRNYNDFIFLQDYCEKNKTQIFSVSEEKSLLME